MQYLLMIYSNEAGMAAAPAGGVKQMNAAYAAYTEAMRKAGVVRRRRPAASDLRGDHGAREGRQDRRCSTALRRHQGAACRLLPDRRARSRRGAVLGRALPRRCDGTIEVRPIWPMQMAKRDGMPMRSAARARGRRRRSRAAATASSSRSFRRARATSRRRGCARRRFRGGARRLAGERHPAKSRSVAARGRAAQDDRRGAATPHRATKARTTSPDRTTSSTPRPAAATFRIERLALMFACAHPAIDAGDPRAADPADGARLRCRDHRIRVSRCARHDGPAPRRARRTRSRQAGIPFRVPGARRTCRSARCGARRDLRGVRRGLVRSGRHRDAPPQSRRRKGSGSGGSSSRCCRTSRKRSGCSR